MPDITMCYNSEQCPSEEHCYRATAIPTSHIQSYAVFYEIGKECEHFWSNEGKTNVTSKGKETDN